MKKWKIELTVEVSENWIQDGFDLNEPEAWLLGFARDNLWVRLPSGD